VVEVPAGAIYSLTDGTLIANNTLNPTTHTATVSLSASKKVTDWYTSNCQPCNLGTPSTTTGAFVVASKDVTLTNAALIFAPSSSVYIRRTKYTPLNAQAVAAAQTQANSWSDATIINVNQCEATPAPSNVKAAPTTAVVLPPGSTGSASGAALTPSMASTVAEPETTQVQYGAPATATFTGMSGKPVNSYAMTTTQLLAASANQCQAMATAFEVRGGGAAAFLLNPPLFRKTHSLVVVV
jgi:hypothetical protein